MSAIKNNPDKKAAVYIHFPFCIQKCKYCDFFSVRQNRFSELLKPHHGASPFSKKILQDLKKQKDQFDIKEFTSVYIGGGTPSLLKPKDVFFLTSSISKLTNYADIEFTIEANPDSLTADFIKAANDGGVNRFSMGVQTLNTEILKTQNRIGSKSITLNALHLLKNFAEKQNVKLSFDLIAGFEGQNRSILADDINTLLKFDAEHISLYSLCTNDSRADAENNFSAELWLHGCELLKRHGYTRYEVSNFAKTPEDKCRHNLTYWNLDSYLGLGPSAVGTIIHKDCNSGKTVGFRTEGIKNISDWFKSKKDGYKTENISTQNLIKESLMMGFRLKDGINLADFSGRFNLSLPEIIKKTLQKWQKRNLIKLSQTHCFLTDDGLAFLNQFLIDAFTEL
ncbi:MAG: coproporphyrinogen III oxidase [Treponema sp.]|nr:MAG: coproporphyrinogen III oxidase [Treponema sp.]